MGKTKKIKRKPSGSHSPPQGSVSPAMSSPVSTEVSPSSVPASESQSSIPKCNASDLVQKTVSAIKVANSAVATDLGLCISAGSEAKSNTIENLSKNASAPVIETSSAIVESLAPGSSDLGAGIVEPEITPSVSDPIVSPVEAIVSVSNSEAATTSTPAAPTISTPTPSNEWVGLFKGSTRKLSKKGVPFTLPNGEVCVKIPNSVIEKHQKSWESFIIGQFYADPPPQALVHTIVNGFWSRQFKDISVSRLEGNAYLFRIPNVQTRRRVLNQRLWKIDGQTMFVADWEPGMAPVTPELTIAPIWLELRNVPLQFFNEEGLEHIAGLVGHPDCLHPDTINKSNLEVAKVFTFIDPRKPLPEGVNVQFQSGEIRRVSVSSPWMPPICSHCKEVGHSLKRCKTAPSTCSNCSSTVHLVASCPRIKGNGTRLPQKARSTAVAGVPEIRNEEIPPISNPLPATITTPKGFSYVAKGASAPSSSAIPPHHSVIASENARNIVTSSKGKAKDSPGSAKSTPKVSEADSDSSDISSSEEEDPDSPLEEEHEYLEVVSKKNRRNSRGFGLKLH
ncbi:uncharacterized protein LOC111831932 [Capsella rubella]|uniref:uncharacterized protein LOC111831932 n=1 Tax=Capsella rubella TaxID=81985 RepID=UPI000CD4FDB4|nr:uncharacterized protein LOC111831932 [Capsella rubella]